CDLPGSARDPTGFSLSLRCADPSRSRPRDRLGPTCPSLIGRPHRGAAAEGWRRRILPSDHDSRGGPRVDRPARRDRAPSPRRHAPLLTSARGPGALPAPRLTRPDPSWLRPVCWTEGASGADSLTG